MRFIFVSLLIATAAFGVEIQTGRISNSAAGSQDDSVVVNSTSPAWTVLNQGFAPSGSCVPTPITSRPLVYQQYFSAGTTVSRNTIGTHWTYPLNIAGVNSLQVRFCYHVAGTVPVTMILEPVLKDTLTGGIYAPGGGITIPAGTYVVGSGQSATTSAVINWSLSLFPMSSYDLATYRYEFGFRVREFIFSGFPLDATAIKVHAMDLKSRFNLTSPPGAPIMPSPTYTSNVPWGQSTLMVSQTMPNPSTAYQINLYIRCSDFVFRPLDSLVWGSGTTQVRTFNMSFLNSSKCPGAGSFSQGSRTQVRSTLYFNGTEYSSATTGDIILY